jgi:glutathione S-transferase
MNTSATTVNRGTKRWTLHGSPHSQFTYKVALMLRLSGQPFHFRYVSFQRGAHRTPEFRALSRFGQVPVLEIGSRVLCQSAAILEYLAEILQRFSAPESEHRQQIREWLYWDADRLAPPVYGCYGDILAQRKLLAIPQRPVVSEYFQQRADAALTVLDTQLAAEDHLVAGRPTIADLACYGDVVFAGLAEIDLSRFTHIKRWRERLARLEGFHEPFELLRMEDLDVE